MRPTPLSSPPEHQLVFSFLGKLINISLAPRNKEVTKDAMGVKQCSCYHRTTLYLTQNLKHKNTIYV